jgi:hypothetical protein
MIAPIRTWGERRRGLVRRHLDRVFGIDLRALAAFRIAAALLLLFDLSTRFPFLADFYTDAGLLPRSLVPYWPASSPTSLHTLHGSFAFVATLYAIGLGAAVLLLVGLATRLALAVSYLHALSLWWRNPGVLNAGDGFFLLLLFWSLFLPLGARYSLDARRRGGAAGAPVRVLSVASAGVLLHLAYFYFFSVFHKVQGSGWWEGTAVLVAVSHEIWRRPLGEWLLGMPVVLSLFTWGTLALELAGPLLLLSPFRTVPLRILAMVGFAGLQIGLGLCLRLWLFPWVMTIGLLPFTPTAVIDAVEARVRRRPPERAPGGTAPLGLCRIGTVLAAIALAYVTFSHVERVVPGGPPPRALTRVGRFFGLNQGPVMYATQRLYDAELQIAGVRADGVREVIDDAGATGTWPPLARIRRFHRGKAYLERLAEMRLEAEQQGFGEWVCREWNAAHAPAERVREIEVVGIRRTIALAPGEPRESYRGVLRRVPCAAAAG